MSVFTAEAGDIALRWVSPERDGTTPPLVIWLPGFSGDKEQMQPYLEDLAGSGFLALSFDPHQHGSRRIESVDALRTRVRGNIRRWFWPILAQTARDVSKVIDWSRANLAIAPVCGVGGISMGGDIAIAAAGLDRRIGAVSAGIATPDWMRPGASEPQGEADGPAWAAYRACNPLTHPERYRHTPALAFECGAEDRQVPADGAARFVEMLADRYRHQPDRLRVCLHPGTAHRYETAMWRHAQTWFRRHLLETAPSPPAGDGAQGTNGIP